MRGKILRLLATAFSLGAAAVLALVLTFYIQYRRNDRLIVLPTPRGSHPVGRILMDWYDTRRSRELMVFIWYPAQDDASGRHCEYIPGKWGELEAQRMLPIPARRYQEIHASAIESAPLASGVMPVLVLLPGMGRIPAHYTTLAEDLASYGYVIVGVTPTGSSRPVVFSDGRVVEGSEFDPDVESRAQAQQLIETWAADASFSLDQLCREPHFAARLHLNRTGIFGHSFGGDVAAHALRVDSKFSRAASLDGGPPFFGDSITRLDRPLLILEGGPEIHRTACDFDRTNCTIRSYADARHMNFSDAGILPSRLPFPKSLMMLGDVDGAQFLRDVSDRLRDFFSQM